MAGSERCGNCGKTEELRRCNRCRCVSYCSAECQREAWRRHKKMCREPTEEDLPLDAVLEKVRALSDADDNTGVLRWEHRLEDLLTACTGETSHDEQDELLSYFACAHNHAGNEQRSADLHLRRAELLGSAGLFEEQAEALWAVGQARTLTGNLPAAAACLRESQALSEEHSLKGMESKACGALGSVVKLEGNFEEAMTLWHRALDLVEFVPEEERAEQERFVLLSLVTSLQEKGGEHDAEAPLVARFLAAAQVESTRRTRTCGDEILGRCWSVRLHREAERHSEAADECRAAISLAEEHPEAVGESSGAEGLLQIRAALQELEAKGH